PRGDARDHARVGPLLPARARGRRCRSGGAARGDRPARAGREANVLAAARELPGQDRPPDLAGVDVKGSVRSDETSVFPRFLDLDYPNVERGEGVWLTTTDGTRSLAAWPGCSLCASRR